MQKNFDFNLHLLQTFLGGASVLDFPRLQLRERDAAIEFLRGYGFDWADESDQARLWSFHRRAVSYIQTQLLQSGEFVPSELADPLRLRDLPQLLLWASGGQGVPSAQQQWACAILRVMHVMAHLTSDLFTAFSEEIQEQILAPYHQHVQQDEGGVLHLQSPMGGESIRLAKFDIKPFKTSNSAITKLLAKPEEVAFSLLDKMGVRFVTHSIFDCFRVLRFLNAHNILSFPHLIPDQSNNTLYPLNLFMEVMEQASSNNLQTDEEIEELLHLRLTQAEGRASYREKLNIFTSRDYRFMKFIVRRLIRAQHEGWGRPFMFFYPYEVQIMDESTYARNSSGPSSHQEYKGRQRRRARERVFGRFELPTD